MGSRSVRKFLLLFVLLSSSLFFSSAQAGSSRADRAKALKYCRELLLNTKELPRFVEVKGAPALRVLDNGKMGEKVTPDEVLKFGGMHDHELTSGMKYAEILEKRDEILVLIPSIDKQSVPGFDGIILNRHEHPIANFSLKTVLETGDEEVVRDMLHKLTEGGVKKAKKYSRLSQWLVNFNLLLRNEEGSVQLSPMHRRPHQVKRVGGWLSKALKLFGIKGDAPPERKTRIVVDIIDRDFTLTSEDISQVKALVTNASEDIESVIFLQKNQVIQVR